MNTVRHYILSFVLLMPALLLASATQKNDTASKSNDDALAVFYTIEGNIQEKHNEIIRQKIKSTGFQLTDPHKRVNDQYKVKYGSTVLDVLTFLPVVNDEIILPLLNIDPRIAGFAPFNMLVYKKLDENKTHIGHLMPKIMLDILGIEDKKVREAFTGALTSLDTAMEQELGSEKSYIPYKKLPEQRMINFEYEFDAPEDMDDFIEEFQNNFELAFIDKEYLIAGYHNFMEATDDAEEILAGYDAFWTYSLCHLEFSYNMFDNEGARPEAGIFAPCTMYMYIKKGSNKLVVGMYRLHNWSDTLNITDKERVALVERLDKEIPEILTAFGMTATSNTNTLLEADANDTKKKIATEVKKVQADIPTLLIETKPQDIQSDKCKVEKTVHANIGAENQGKISAYLRGEFMDVKTVEEKLKTAGFEVLASVPVNKDGTLTSVVFTDKSLITMSSKENRGFMASLRVLVDTKDKIISIINPLYIAKGFLQNDFEENAAKEILAKLVTQFPNLENSKDSLESKLLPKYQFMFGMPHYEDMIEVAQGDDLLEMLKDNGNVLFAQNLENGSTLIGIQLSKRTNSFTRRIGRNNAAMLPYPILIENGKAKILDPKYYIAYMYPMLKMSEFMTIATIPDAIIKDCEKIFKGTKKK
ncbi:hypothetical protein [Sulfurovum sp.]|uniref:hypothetical protein n=1 Tax=Sulfurovum sp. TaxID=1969726 RepID=UPI002867CC58|nr:hypothetical protein [Sulfurovum sp.]